MYQDLQQDGGPDVRWFDLKRRTEVIDSG